MAVNTELEHALILRGAFAFLDRISQYGLSDAETDQALIRWAGGSDRLDADTAFDTVVQYQLYRQGGSIVERRNDNRTIYARNLPTIFGCKGPFSYTVVIPVYNSFNDTESTKAFEINSPTALGKQDVLNEAARAAAVWAGDLSYQVQAYGEDPQWQILGNGRITAAAKCAN